MAELDDTDEPDEDETADEMPDELLMAEAFESADDAWVLETDVSEETSDCSESGIDKAESVSDCTGSDVIPDGMEMDDEKRLLVSAGDWHPANSTEAIEYRMIKVPKADFGRRATLTGQLGFLLGFSIIFSFLSIFCFIQPAARCLIWPQAG